jgi:hypothetical protein
LNDLEFLDEKDKIPDETHTVVAKHDDGPDFPVKWVAPLVRF